jgi:hypothetical protein
MKSAQQRRSRLWTPTENCIDIIWVGVVVFLYLLTRNSDGEMVAFCCGVFVLRYDETISILHVSCRTTLLLTFNDPPFQIPSTAGTVYSPISSPQFCARGHRQISFSTWEEKFGEFLAPNVLNGTQTPKKGRFGPGALETGRGSFVSDKVSETTSRPKVSHQQFQILLIFDGGSQNLPRHYRNTQL